jgi:ppGpp synthetase/RelA/SpoT-type nucleotidyltranferase
VVKVSKSGNSIKVKLADGTERIISLDPKSGAYQNIRNPNYVIRYGAGNNTQGKSLLQLTKKQINDTREILIKRKKHFEDKGITNQGAYRDIVQDLNALDFTVNKAITDINSPRIEKATDNLTSAIKNLKNEEGFSITIDGKAPADLGYNKGYMVAPLKATEIKLGNTFTDEDMLRILENVYALEKSLKINRVDYGEVYVGAWKNADGTYVFDASVRIDNLDEAIYIAKFGEQDAIFDLSKFDTIDTGKGYEQLKTDKLFSDDKAIKQAGKTSEIETEFRGIRSKIQTEKATFNKNESKLAEDIEGVKDFDAPNEAAYRNQALYAEASMFDEGTSLAIRSEAGAGAAAKTVPTGKPLAKTQDLVSKSQLTETAPPSTVLATAQSKPPLLTRGETNKVVGDISSIGFPLYHKTDNFNEIYNTLSKKMDSVKKELQPIATKYNGDLKARIKDIDSLKEKLATKPKMTAQNVSDFLGARISLDTITQAKLVFSELDKKFKLFFSDDFLDDVGRTLTHNTNYRRIHLQALTKDGFSFELQVSLKELDPLIEINHAFYKKLTYQKDRFTPSEIQDLIKKQTVAENNIKNKYFEIKDKEFSKLNPTNDIDFPIVIGTRMDEATGEIVPLTKTARELYEEAGKNETMMKRLEQCMGW